MKKAEIEQTIADNLHNELSEEQASRFDLELSKAPELKMEVEELKLLWKKLEDVRLVPNTERLDRKFYQMLETEKKAKLPIRRTNWYTQPAWQVAAAALIIVAIYSVVVTLSKSGPGITDQISIVSKRNSLLPATVTQPVQGNALAKTSISRKLPKFGRRAIIRTKDRFDAGDFRSSFVSQRIAAVNRIAMHYNSRLHYFDFLAGLLQTDESANVRVAAVDALRPIAKRSEVQAVLINAVSQQQDEIVKRYIIELLFEVKAKQAIPTMTAILNDDNVDPLTRSQIKDGITNLN